MFWNLYQKNENIDLKEIPIEFDDPQLALWVWTYETITCVIASSNKKQAN